MDDPNVLSYSMKFLSYCHQLEYRNQDMFLRGRFCQICELEKMQLGEVMSRYTVKVPMAD